MNLKETIGQFFDFDLHLESRTVFIGDGENEDGEIDASVSKRVIKAFHLLSQTPNEPVTVLLNSFGGCWFHGMAIYDAVKLCPCQVTAIVVGSAMSMGSIILQAADIRQIYPNATIMVHDGFDSISGVPQTFQNWADYNKVLRNGMYAIYSSRSGRTKAFWKRKCANDFILTASDALELGLVDEIFES